MNNVQSSYKQRNNMKTFHFYQNKFYYQLFEKTCDSILI